MKRNLLCAAAAIVMSATAATNAVAQCTCNQPDPKGYSSTSCGLQTAGLSGPTNICNIASSCTSGTSYTYTITFPTSATGYFWRITGGYGYRELIYVNNSSTVDRNNCGINTCPGTANVQCREYGNSNGIYQVTLYVRWTTPGANNKIELWGYTGISGGFPATLTYFNCFPVNMLSVPAAPTSISLSSPTSYPVCGWKIACTYISNATYYNWSGAAYGSYTNFVGPTVAGPQTAYLCVNTSNACGTSATYCSNLVIPRNTSCQKSAAIAAGSTENSLSKDITEKKSFVISPNPASKAFSIYLNKPGKYTAELLSLMGSSISKQTVVDAARINFNVSALSKGMYIVVVYDNGTIIAREKVMIQ